MSLKDLRAALEVHLQGMTDYLGDANTQFQNQTFDPTAIAADQPYKIVNILLADPSNAEMGRFFQEQGFMQISLRYPANKGAGDAEVMAQKIRDRFYRGLNLTANGFTVTILYTPTIGPGAQDGDRYSVPIKIRFFANNAS